MAPNEKMSIFSVYLALSPFGSPPNPVGYVSGAAYTGVPGMAVAYIAPRGNAFAWPKSAIFACKVFVNNTFFARQVAMDDRFFKGMNVM